MGGCVVAVRSIFSQIREATVETHTPPDGKRLLNSPYMRAMPPRSGGKSCVRNKILQVRFTLRFDPRMEPPPTGFPPKLARGTVER
jgi:hypothetical protein